MKVVQALLISFILSSTFLGVASLTVAQVTKSPVPRVFLIDGRRLAETKRRIQSGDKTFAAALAKLETDAKLAMQQKPLSVITKDVTPRSKSQPTMFWLQRSQMFIAFLASYSMALQRSAMYWVWMSSSNHAFRSAGAKNLLDWEESINIRSHWD